jgi:NAD(P)H-nitrite reductase large subunit
MNTKIDYLIIGGGAAGVTAGAEIRKIKPDASIAIISQESVCFYSRVLLTNYLKGEVKKEELILRDEEWFGKQGIKLFLNESVTSLEAKGHRVLTSRGREVEYTKLLIATGVRPRILPVQGGDLPGVFYLWDMADAEAILARIVEIKKLPKEHQVIAVIGGGFICQSLVKIFHAHNLKTHLLMRGKYYWSKFISEPGGELLSKKFEENGIIMHKGTRTDEIVHQDDGALLIKTEAGEEIKAAMVIVGVGTLPNTAWLESSGIELDNGIKVNEHMETSLADVYAAGDVVSFYDLILEDFHRKGNWVNASRQGRVAGVNVAGGAAEFNEVTSFTVDIFGLEFIFLGEYNRAMADRVVVRSKKDKVREYYFKSDRLIGATLINCQEDRPLIERAIKDKIKLLKSEQLSLSEASKPLTESKIYGAK